MTKSDTNGHAPERVALYMRVSSEEQRDHDNIDLQAQFFADYTRLYGLEVIHTYTDDGVSGTIPLAERPEGARLLEDAAKGEFDTLLVYKLDRLGRKLLVTVDAHDRLQEARVSLRSATEPIDTSTPSGRLIFQMLASFAEYEREAIRERTSDGLARAYRNGAQLGMIPYAYDISEDGEFVIVEDEAKIVRELFENIAAGSTLSHEAERLSSAGIGSPGSKYRGRPRKHGLRWSRSTVRGIIKQGAYSGTHTVRSARKGVVSREVPAIVTPETQQRALARLQANKHLVERKTDRKYLLRGLVKCASCGRSYGGGTSTANGKRYHYYNCPRDVPKAHGHSCPRVRADWLEALVWGDLRTFLENPGEVLEQVAEQIEREYASDEPEKRRANLAHRLAAKREEAARYQLLFSRKLLEEDDEEALTHLLDLKHQIDNLKLLLEHAEADLSAREQHRLTTERTAAWLAALRGRVEEIEGDDPGSFAARRELVQLLVQGIDVGRDDSGRVKVSVTYRFGPPPEDPDGNCVYGVSHTKESILQNAACRLGNSREEEVEVALGEIAKIARLRLRELVETDEAHRENRARR
jgi:site-specific DNA recombinase